MNSERKEFINALKKLDYFNHATKRWDEANNRFEHDGVQTHWEMWKASTQRQGYKFVPLNPTEEMINKVDGVFEVPSWDSNIAIDSDCCINIYKAMIGVVDNDH